MEPEKENNMKKKENFVKKCKKNPWVLSTLILGILTLILLANISSGSITGKVISKTDAGDMLLNFWESKGTEGLALDSVETEGDFYKVILIYDGNKIPFYMTKTGYMMGNDLVSIVKEKEKIDTEVSQEDVPKSDKPILEAFLSPYCPYGLQYMKGLIPVFDLLKNSADIRIKYIGITHMNLEELETTRQLCILNEYNKEKLFDYLRNIIYNDGAKVCYNDWHSGEYARDDAHFTECMAPIIKNSLNKINVDENKINDCIGTNGEKYYQEAVDYSRESGVSASPTPKINGVKVSGRSPEVIKQAICSAFNNIPSECSIELSGASPSPGFGYAEGRDTGAQC